MSTYAADAGRLTREQGRVTAARRKAARARKTSRIRKTTAAIAIAAFLGPFAVIYADGAGSMTTKPRPAAVARTSSGSTSSGSSSAAAPVTTQQS